MAPSKLTDRLRDKAAEHQKQADYHTLRAEAFRIAAEEIEAEQRSKRAKGVEAFLDAGVALDEERQAQAPPPAKRRGRQSVKTSDKDYHHADKVRIRRARSADLLGRFSTDTPKTFAEAGLTGNQPQGMSRLVAYGYLKKHKSGGFLRTNKVFHVDKADAAAANGTHA